MQQKIMAGSGEIGTERALKSQYRELLQAFRTAYELLPVEIEELEQFAYKHNVLFHRSLVDRHGSLIAFYHYLDLGTAEEEEILLSGFQRLLDARDRAPFDAEDLSEGLLVAYTDFFGLFRSAIAMSFKKDHALRGVSRSIAVH